MSFSRKLIVAQSCLIMVSIAIIAAFVSRLLIGDMQLQYQKDKQFQLTQMMQHMTYLNESVYQFTANMASDEELQNYIFQKEKSKYSSKTQAYLCSLVLKKYKSQNDMVHSIVCITSDGTIVWDEFNDEGGFGAYMDEKWYADYQIDRNNISLPHVLTDRNQRQTQVSSYVFPVVNIDDAQMKKGQLIVNINFERLSEPIQLLQEQFSAVQWYNLGDQLIYSYDHFAQQTGRNTNTIEASNEIGRCTASYVGMRFFATPTLSVLAFLMLTILVLTILIMIPIVHMLTRPLTNLAHVMESLSHDVSDEKIAQTVAFADTYPKGNVKEIVLLYKGFDEMIAELEQRTLQKVEAERKANVLQIDLLYAQLNPHFLYNTLNTVIFMAQTQGNNDIADIVDSLITILQGTLRFDGNSFMSTLGKELDTVRQYCNIQRYKYPNMFELLVDVQDELLDLQIPHFLLQPLVENSLFHGIHPKGTPGEIWITGCIQGNHLIVEVGDNGVGMDEYMLLKLLEGDRIIHADSFRKSVGMEKVRELMRFIYGDAASFDINSSIGFGTCVVLTFPIWK